MVCPWWCWLNGLSQVGNERIHFLFRYIASSIPRQPQWNGEISIRNESDTTLCFMLNYID